MSAQGGSHKVGDYRGPRNLGQNLGPMLVEREVVRPDELERVLALYADASFGYLSGLNVAAWGRRPER